MTAEEQLLQERINKALERPLIQKALVMNTLLTGYQIYHNIENSRALSMTDIDYAQAEKLSEAFEKVMNLRVRTEDLLFDKDEETNKAIDEYARLQELLKTSFDETLQKAAMAFYKQIYNKEVSPYFRIGGYITYPNTLAALFNYVIGRCGKEAVWDTIVSLNPFTMQRQRIDSMFFRKDIYKLYDIFVEIANKQRGRR